MVVSQEYGTGLKFKVLVSTLQRTDSIDDSVQSAKGLSQNLKKKKAIPSAPGGHPTIILPHFQTHTKRSKKLLHYI
jgi:hypothetical protein